MAPKSRHSWFTTQDPVFFSELELVWCETLGSPPKVKGGDSESSSVRSKVEHVPPKSQRVSDRCISLPPP